MLIVLVVAIVAVLALVPLVRELRRGPGTPARIGAAFAAMLVVATVWGGATRMREPAVAPVNRPLEIAGDDSEFVSSRACRSCHPAEHASWHASFHRTMTTVASEETVIPSFDGVEVEARGETYRLHRLGSAFEAELTTQLPGRDRPEKVRRRIVQVTGSHHFQAFWYPSGRSRELSLLPIVYRIDTGRWVPVESAFLMPPEVRQPPHGGRWNHVCSDCHATGKTPPAHERDPLDTRVAELGIACEACHGSCDEHAAANRDPLRRYLLQRGGDADSTVVDPSRLDPQRASEVCGRCHAVTIPRVERLDEPFRPGESLEDSRLVVTRERADEPAVRREIERHPQFLDSLFWSDGTVRVSGREYNGLIRSACFTHDGPDHQRMSCLSCHEMHPDSDDPRTLAEWRDDQLGRGMRTNRACTQCHGDLADDAALERHTGHDAGSSGSNCYDCHMSHTTYGLLKAIRSHTIEVPTVQSELDTGRPNACNQCHLDRTLQWTAEKLHERYGTPVPELDPEQREVAASILWALRGDAGQRALAAWSMGWEDARATSGTSWTTPYLTELMDDPYDAVRFIAERSLRKDPRFEAMEFDFLAPSPERRASTAALLEGWSPAPEARRAELLIGKDGALLVDVFARLLAARDLRPVFLAE